MLTKFNSRYDLPSRNNFSSVAIPSLYSEVKSDIQQQINNGQFFYAGTTDLWSSLTSEPYLSYTIHFIDKHWTNASKPTTCQKIILTSICKKHWNPHSQWGLDPEKQICNTTDSGSNIKLACELLGWQGLSCLGHNLDLSVNKGLNDDQLRVDTMSKNGGSFFTELEKIK